jgi:hypothetical protein
LSINWQSDAEPRPRILVLPRAAASLDEAHAAIELWEHYKRCTLDPTQRLAVEVMMATDAAGLWAAPTTGREMPRQNGKGDEIEVVELWGLVQRAERILHTIHDAVLLATETQARLLSVIEGHPDLRRLKLRAWRGTGQQMIELRNGGIIWYRTRTGGGARGIDEVDRIVIDEAQHAEPEHLSAITPTQLASPNPQTNAMGTSGIEGKSAWWWMTRKRALSDTPGDFGYVGHTAEVLSLGPEGRVTSSVGDVTDPERWRENNPALVAGRTGERFFAEQLRLLGPRMFAREHMGVWDPEPGVEGAVIDPVSWAKLADKGSSAADPVAFAVDISPDRRSSSIAACGRREDGLLHLEIVENRPGTGWLVDRVREIADNWRPCAIAVDPGGPAGSIVPLLAEVGLKITELGARDLGQACGGLHDDVVESTVRHLGQFELDSAVAVARSRPLGDAWRWSRKGDHDISPLYAATVARFAFLTAEQNPDSAYEVRGLVTL